MDHIATAATASHKILMKKLSILSSIQQYISIVVYLFDTSISKSKPSVHFIHLVDYRASLWGKEIY